MCYESSATCPRAATITKRHSFKLLGPLPGSRHLNNTKHWVQVLMAVSAAWVTPVCHCAQNIRNGALTTPKPRSSTFHAINMMLHRIFLHPTSRKPTIQMLMTVHQLLHMLLNKNIRLLRIQACLQPLIFRRRSTISTWKRG